MIVAFFQVYNFLTSPYDLSETQVPNDANLSVDPNSGLFPEVRAFVFCDQRRKCVTTICSAFASPQLLCLAVYCAVGFLAIVDEMKMLKLGNKRVRLTLKAAASGTQSPVYQNSISIVAGCT